MCNGKDEGIWIDEICIDQSNDEEKMNDIAIMNYIYECARQPVIVLEDILVPFAKEKVVAKYLVLRKKENPFPGTERWSLAAISTEYIHLIRSFFHRVVSSRRFARAWCHHVS